MATRTRSLRLGDVTWETLQRKAEDAGLSTRTAFIESVASGANGVNFPARQAVPAEVKLVEVEKIVYVEKVAAPGKPREQIYFPEFREVLRLAPARDRTAVESSDELEGLVGRLYDVFCRATETENKETNDG